MFLDCNWVDVSLGSEAKHWGYRPVLADARWRFATLLVVTSRQNLDRRDAMHAGASTYSLDCSYVDRP
jgi:hypothetical protein